MALSDTNAKYQIKALLKFKEMDKKLDSMALIKNSSQLCIKVELSICTPNTTTHFTSLYIQ